MRFSKRQQELLSTTLQSLVRYVNGRIGLVRESDLMGEERDACHELVERYLWQHSSLIGDYVRENPDGLSSTYLDIASQLAGTLYGSVILESHVGETAVFLHQTGVYVAAAPKLSSCEDLPHGFYELRGALVPFEDLIVALPSFTMLGNASASQVTSMHETLAASGIDRPISEAREFSQRVREWHKRQSRMKEERLSAQPPAEQVTGFHRGALAGLCGNERLRAKAAHLDQTIRENGGIEQAMALRCTEADTMPTSLEEVLVLLEDEWLCDIAGELDEELDSATMSRAELVSTICQQVIQNEQERDALLLWTFDTQFELLEQLMQCGTLALDELAPSVAVGLFPLLPYVFMLHVRGSIVAWMPPEIRTFFLQADLKAIRTVREQLEEIRACACAMATLCGIVSVSDVYERYRKVVGKPCDRAFFEEALEELDYSDSRDAYTLWRHLCCDYVISEELSDASAAARLVRESYAHRILEIDEDLSALGNPTLVGLAPEEECTFTKRLAKREAALERTRISLLKHKASLRPPDLSPRMLATAPLDALMERDALRALREFVDAHIPDGEDDYEFADLFVRSVVVSCVLMNDSYNDTIDLIRLYGMLGCEGTDFPDTLGQLVTNAFNALPRWQLNGWSLEENTERITGKRRFYGKDGKPLAIANDEPCPCGSGKAYGKCCGNLHRER